MPIIHGGASAPSLPYAYHVRRVPSGEPFRWLVGGGRDLVAAPAASLLYGLLFVVAGYILTFGLWRIHSIYLLLPLVSGFMLLGPALTLGFQAISRDLERHERPSFSGALLAWQENAGPIFYAGLAFMFLFLVWFRLAELIFALSIPDMIGMDARGVIDAILFTVQGQTFLALFVVLGAGMAMLAFAGGAFALPMLLDRRVGMSEAIATSFTAVMLNLRTMALWAVLLVVLTAVGMMAFFVGLAITLPLAGHATWHAYRAVIRPEA
jgi:uncharacterized membrane protein